MKAIFTPDGVKLVVEEPQPIPLADAVKAVEAIADKQREALEQCTQQPITTTTETIRTTG